MRILVNETPLALGDSLPASTRIAAGLQPCSVGRRIVAALGLPAGRFEVRDCTLDLFDGDFRIYPCTEGYIDRDRQWHTAVDVVVKEGRLYSVEARVIEGRYAAPEFVDRFVAACDARWGESQMIDRRTRRWRNGVARFLSQLQPDGRNAVFVVEMI